MTDHSTLDTILENWHMQKDLVPEAKAEILDYFLSLVPGEKQHIMNEKWRSGHNSCVRAIRAEIEGLR